METAHGLFCYHNRGTNFFFSKGLKPYFKKAQNPNKPQKVKTKGQKVWLKLLLIRHLYPGLAVQAPRWHIQTYLILVAFKAFFLMQATSATVEKIKGTKGERKKMNPEERSKV